MTSVHWRRGHRRHVGEDPDARVVDHDVEATEARDRRVDRTLHVLGAAHVGLQRLDRTWARRLDGRARRGQMGFAASGRRDLHALGHQRARDRETDAARSAGDDGDLAAKRLHSHYNNPPDARSRDRRRGRAGWRRRTRAGPPGRRPFDRARRRERPRRRRQGARHRAGRAGRRFCDAHHRNHGFRDRRGQFSRRRRRARGSGTVVDRRRPAAAEASRCRPRRGPSSSVPGRRPASSSSAVSASFESNVADCSEPRRRHWPPARARSSR